MTTLATAAIPTDDDSTKLSKTVLEASRVKTPPQETPQHVQRRRLIILSLWAIVLAIGLPIWYHTTAVYRAVLPLQLMTDWAEGRVCQTRCSCITSPADHHPPLDMYSRLSFAHKCGHKRSGWQGRRRPDTVYPICSGRRERLQRTSSATFGAFTRWQAGRQYCVDCTATSI